MRKLKVADITLAGEKDAGDQILRQSNQTSIGAKDPSYTANPLRQERAVERAVIEQRTSFL
jgi:hypothetical protein